jgi:hypothetical protein
VAALVLRTATPHDRSVLRAQIHRKLSRNQENLEDILISNVFGVLSHLPPADGIARLLERVEGVDREALRTLLRSPLVAASYQFWPRLERDGCRACEPDVLIRIEMENGARGLICVEAKYTSGKSSATIEGAPPLAPPNDQLARQWDHTTRIAAEEGRQAFLVYVTAHYARPDREIEESQAELIARRGERGRLVWLPWRAVSELELGSSALAAELIEVMRDRYELTFFTGIRISPRPLAWAFAAPPPRFSWEFTTSNNWGWSR